MRDAFTVMVLDDAHARVRRFRVSIRALIVMTLCAVGVGGGVLLIVAHYASLVPRVFDASRLRVERAALERDLATLELRSGEINRSVASLAELEDRLRSLSGVSESASPWESMQRGSNAQGGGASVSDGALAVALAGDGGEARAARERLVEGRLAYLFGAVEREQRSLDELGDYFVGQRTLLRSTPSIAPTRGFLTSGYGVREDPFTSAGSAHSGDDIAAPIGTDVVAPADGTVILAGDNGGYGQCIIIEHRAGLTTVYGHLSSILVKLGEKVVRGERIGRVGSTGRSTGPHLHYEVRRNGVPLNPRRFIIR